MDYDPKGTMNEFNRLMVDIKGAIPKEYQTFIQQKSNITSSGKLPQKDKWLLILVSSVTAKCPVCIPRAVKHCLESGWSKEEMLEACMAAVLVGGSSVMTYVTLAAKAIEDFSS
jgi:alkylhydroperoxidase/carboxymuconolactone decarboxylase family protein YurZ